MQHAIESWNGRTLKVEQGETFDITLAENPTTGYRWSFSERGGPVCLLLEDSLVSQGSATPGQGGLRRLQFRAAEPGTCTIELVYSRPWEPANADRRTFALHLKVHEASGKPAAKPAGSSRSHPID